MVGGVAGDIPGGDGVIDGIHIIMDTPMYGKNLFF